MQFPSWQPQGSFITPAKIKKKKNKYPNCWFLNANAGALEKAAYGKSIKKHIVLNKNMASARAYQLQLFRLLLCRPLEFWQQLILISDKESHIDTSANLNIQLCRSSSLNYRKSGNTAWRIYTITAAFKRLMLHWRLAKISILVFTLQASVSDCPTENFLFIFFSVVLHIRIRDAKAISHVNVNFDV